MKLIDRIVDSLSFLYEEDDDFDEELDLKKPLPAKEPEAEKPEKKSLFSRKNVTSAKEEAVNKPDSAEPAKEKRPMFSFSNPKDKAKEKTVKANDGKMNSRTLNLPLADKLVTVVVLEPANFDDSQKIADCLRGSEPVVVNFKNTDNLVAKRMTDFISGTIYALGGSMKKLGRDILICAPKNVDIDAGEEMYDERGEQPWKK